MNAQNIFALKTPAKDNPMKESFIETITPERATEILEKNKNNRRLQERHVKVLAKEMTEGRWKLNGDAIRIDWDGNLLDGQHRLWACIESGKPFDSVVITGLDPAIMPTIDGGKKRTSADVLKLAGEANTALLGATTRILVAIATDNLHGAVSSGEILKLVSLNPGLRRSVGLGASLTKVAPSLPTAIHYVGSVLQNMPEVADAWMQVLLSGIPAYDGCPVHLLRERLMERNRWAAQVGPRHAVDLHIHTWNNFVQRKKLTRLQAPATTPVLVGLTMTALNTQH